MRMYWIKDKVQGKTYMIYWDQGKNNMADYYTKHFSPTYHQTVRPSYILKGYNMKSPGLICEGVLNHYNLPPQGWSAIGTNKSSHTRMNNCEVQNMYSSNKYSRCKYNDSNDSYTNIVSLNQKLPTTNFHSHLHRYIA